MKYLFSLHICKKYIVLEVNASMVDIHAFYKIIFFFEFLSCNSMMETGLPDDPQHHVPLQKVWILFVSGSLSMPDHWSLNHVFCYLLNSMSLTLMTLGSFIQVLR